jgi:hypothetical protein
MINSYILSHKIIIYNMELRFFLLNGIKVLICLLALSMYVDIDSPTNWAKRVARGTARPGPHKDGSSPLWRVMFGPLPRHVARHDDAFK